jgi:hypothetical protein
MATKAQIDAAIAHVKAVSPNTYEEWVGVIIDFACIACGDDPTRRPGECNPATPAPSQAAFSSLGRATLP